MKGGLSVFNDGRDEVAFGSEPFGPNVVRYQLRYIPNAFVQA